MQKITSRRNPVCQHIKKLGINSNYRKEHGEYLCDGIKLLQDAVCYGIDIPLVLTSAKITFPLSINTKLYYTDLNIINSLSPLTQSQGVLFTCKMPKNITPEDIYDPGSAKPAGTHILLDNLQDPGNVGTIIRTAYAFNMSSVMLYDNTADPYNIKVIRASMGAIFRQRLVHVNNESINLFISKGIKLVGATLEDTSRDFDEISYENSIIAIGNEGSGLSHSVYSMCTEFVKIPMSKNCQSLNAAVAAAIILFKASRNVVN